MPPITSLSQLDFTKTYTYADYVAWKFDEFVELIKGKLMRPMTGPSTQHQKLSQRLEYAILTFLRTSPYEMFHAPFDVRPTRGTPNSDAQIQTVVQPDICVVCDAGKIDQRGCLGAPDWIIEIVSPGNVGRDTKIKFDLYQESGVCEYWVLFPGEKTVLAYVLENERYELAGEYAAPGPMPSAVLPGLAVEWTDVFDGL
ncbi:Uma2 family endonuclease [Hymenobacter terricola]|uniref:Uma2 family endonuclease n=1 Tax=Hymenobacter terricola TaxID=2819236 RepID=UPI001B315EFE|nr:Uma2 family endonuclease [Hymenobacter terricola]